MNKMVQKDFKPVALFGDCLKILPTLEANSIDAVVTDPPYHLTSIVKRFGAPNAAPAQFGTDGVFARASRGFMGKQWDGGDIAQNPALWAEVLRVLKPGGHVVAFSGTRTYHRMACAIEDAGFEIRDQLAWVYGQGFPKSHDVSKAIDRAAGAEREVVGFDEQKAKQQTGAIATAAYGDFSGNNGAITAPATAAAARQWSGWGTALKPAWEPICLARKPLSEPTVAANVLRWGTGAINVDGCRIESGVVRQTQTGGMGRKANPIYGAFENTTTEALTTSLGRWPANLCHDGSQEVLDLFPESKSSGGCGEASKRTALGGYVYGDYAHDRLGRNAGGLGDSGSAARFLYCAKASKADRAGSKHPTVKPVALMRWLCRMVTPPGGTILDPFAGTGTTGQAAFEEGFYPILIENEKEYFEDLSRRLDLPTIKEGWRRRR